MELTDAALSELLEAGLSQKNEVRQQVEVVLERFYHQPGFFIQLLRAIKELSKNVDNKRSLSLCRIATVFLKNGLVQPFYLKLYVRQTRWGDEHKPVTGGEEGQFTGLHAQEKLLIREEIIDLLVVAPPQIQKILCEAIKEILVSEGLDKWPGLQQRLAVLMSSTEDVKQIRASLILVNILYKSVNYYYTINTAFTRKERTEWSALSDFTKRWFEVFYGHAATIAKVEGHDPTAFDLLRLIFKCFSRLTSRAIPSWMTIEILSAWTEISFAVLLKPIGDLSDMDPLVKAQKWAMRAIHRVFMQLSQTRTTKAKKKEQLEHHHKAALMSQYEEAMPKHTVPQVLAVLSNFHQNFRSERFYSEDVVQSALKYLKVAINVEKVFDPCIADAVPTLVRHILLPLICISMDDIKEMDTDPLQLARNHYNEGYAMDNLMSMRAKELLHRLIKHKTDQCLIPVLAVCEAILTDYQANPASEELQYHKEGVLQAVQAIAGEVSKRPKIAPILNRFAREHITPEFKSPSVLLRARACWMLRDLALYNLSEQDTEVIINAYLENFTHSNVIVKVAACEVIERLLKKRHYETHEDGDVSHASARMDLVKRLIAPHVLTILNVLLALVNESLAGIALSLDSIIEEFGREVVPHAVKLISSMAQSFSRLCREDFDDNIDDTVITMFHTVERLVNRMCRDDAHFATAQHSIAPLVTETIAAPPDSSAGKYLQEGLHLLELVFEQSARMSEATWGMWLTLATQCEDMDTNQELMENNPIPVLRAFVMVMREQLTGAHIEQLWRIFDIVMAFVHLDLSESANRLQAFEIFEYIIIYATGVHVESVVRRVFSTMVTMLEQTPTSSAPGPVDDDDISLAIETPLRTRCLEVLSMVIYKYPHAFIKIAIETNKLDFVLNSIDRQRMHYTRLHSRKGLIFASCHLLETALAADMPAQVEPHVTRLLPWALDMFDRLEVLYKYRDQINDCWDDDDDYEDWEVGGDEDEDDNSGVGIVGGGDTQYQATFGADGEFVSVDDEAGEDVWMFGAEEFLIEHMDQPLTQSLFEDVAEEDEYLVFRRTLDALAHRQPHKLQILTANFSDDQRRLFEHVFHVAQQRDAEQGRAGAQTRNANEGVAA